MKVNCDTHGKAMELLYLRLRIEKGISDPEEREQVSRRVEVLEAELRLD